MVIVQMPSNGAWDYAISLDKHKIRSVPIGENEYGHMQFDTLRTVVGEAVYQLKYKGDFSQVELLANSVVEALQDKKFPKIHVVIPMPASKVRASQPVYAVARRVADILGVVYSDQTLIKIKSTGAMKDLSSYSDKVAALDGCFNVNDNLNGSKWNALVIDDLYDSGASIEAACTALKKYEKIENVSVIALTRTG